MSSQPQLWPRNLAVFLGKQTRLESFTSNQFSGRFDEGRQRTARWIREGRLRYKQDMVLGLENAPQAFIGLMEGKNFGKMLVQVAGED